MANTKFKRSIQPIEFCVKVMLPSRDYYQFFFNSSSENNCSADCQVARTVILTTTSRAEQARSLFNKEISHLTIKTRVYYYFRWSLPRVHILAQVSPILSSYGFKFLFSIIIRTILCLQSDFSCQVYRPKHCRLCCWLDLHSFHQRHAIKP